MKKMSVFILGLFFLAGCNHGGDSTAAVAPRATVPAPGSEVPLVLKKRTSVDCPKDAVIDYKYLRQTCAKDTEADFDNCKKLNDSFYKKHSQIDCEWSDSKGAFHHIATVEGSGLDQGAAGTKEECQLRGEEMKSIESDAKRISQNERSEHEQNSKVIRRSKGDAKVETNSDLWREVFNFQDKYGTMKCDGQSTSAFIAEMQSYQK